MKSQRLPIPCPSCRRYLQIRAENLGRTGICQHCGHRFRAEWEGAHVPSRRTETAPGHPGPSSGKLEHRLGVLESEFQGVLAQVQHVLDRNRSRPRQAPSLPASMEAPRMPDGNHPFAWGEPGGAGTFEDSPGPSVEFNPELDEIEEQLEAERDAWFREIERLRGRLQEAEHAREAAEAEHARDRERWAQERRRVEAERDAWKRETETLRGQADAASSSLCFSCFIHPEG